MEKSVEFEIADYITSGDKQYGAGVCPVRDDACPSAIAY